MLVVLKLGQWRTSDADAVQHKRLDEAVICFSFS